MSEVANIINNAEIVGTVRVARENSGTGNYGRKYIVYDSNYFSYDDNNLSVTLQPGSYMLIACLTSLGEGANYANLQFAGMNLSGELRGVNTKQKIVTITSPTSYTYSSVVGTSYAVGSCICLRLN